MHNHITTPIATIKQLGVILGVFMRFFWLLTLIFFIGCSGAEPPSTPTPTLHLETATVIPLRTVDLATPARPTIEIIQITPTPLPTATPTPTPTPIVYVIKEGDTIWSIAYLNGTIPDDLLAKNRDVNPDLLKIGQELLLPPPATPLYETVAETPIPTALRVSQLRLFETPIDSVWVLGEIENLGNLPADNVAIQVALQNGDGETIVEGTNWVVGNWIGAGESAPFAILLDVFDDEPLQPTASIVSGENVFNLGARTLDFTVQDIGFETTGSGVVISGEITNTAELPARNIDVIASIYDTSDALVGFAQIQLAQDALDPQSSLPFRVETTVLGGALVGDVKVQAIGLVKKE